MAKQYDSYSDPTIAYEEHASNSPVFAREQELAQNQRAQRLSAHRHTPGAGSPQYRYPVLTYRYRGDTRFGVIVLLNQALVAINAFIIPFVLGGLLASFITALSTVSQTGGPSRNPWEEFWALYAVTGFGALIVLVLFLASVVFDAYTVFAAIKDSMRWRRFRGLTGWAAILVGFLWLLPALHIGITWMASRQNWTNDAVGVYYLLGILIVIAMVLMRLTLAVLGIIRLARSDYIADYPDDHPALAEARSKGIDIEAARAYRI